MNSAVASLALAPKASGDVLARGRKEARGILATGSKSFALAGLLLGKTTRDDAAVLYAFCRRADDAVDGARPGTLDFVLDGLAREVDAIYRGDDGAPLRVALSELVARRRIPRVYFDELLAGFAMDARAERYTTMANLDRYGYRVAGVVGLMMCHVLGVRDDRCLPAAAYLGLGMQLTNIARDVVEDAGRGRQYLPTSLIAPPELCLALSPTPTSTAGRQVLAGAVAALLDRADVYYQRGLDGLSDLSARDAFAIGAAARIYRAIGRILRRRAYAVWRGRAVVSTARKLWLVAVSAMATVLRRKHASGLRVPGKAVEFHELQIQ